MRKPVYGGFRPGLTQTRQMAGGLEFRIKEEDGLYYLCSENKGYRTADLRFCFRICKNQVFLMTELKYFLYVQFLYSISFMLRIPYSS